MVIENAFCVYFALEIGVRLIAFEVLLPGLRDHWVAGDAGTRSDPELTVHGMHKVLRCNAQVISSHSRAGAEAVQQRRQGL